MKSLRVKLVTVRFNDGAEHTRAADACVVRRPVLVIQSDPFNESPLSTAMVAVVTSNLRLTSAPGSILVEKHESRLPRDSVINVSQVLTVDKSFLTERVSLLRSEIMTRVDAGLKLVLAYEPGWKEHRVVARGDPRWLQCPVALLATPWLPLNWRKHETGSCGTDGVLTLRDEHPDALVAGFVA